MFLKNVKYLKSAPSKEFWPINSLNEFVFLGKSNVGKSSLINSLCNSKVIAKVSSTPGHTKYLNFFDVDGCLRIVDSPGYGYARADYHRDASFATMMKQYLSQRDNLRGAALLIDSKRTPDADDVAVFNMLMEANVPFIIIATKCDRLNQSERSKIKKNFANGLHLENPEIVYFAGYGIQPTNDLIIKTIYQLCTNK